jgi:hypothetical protein
MPSSRAVVVVGGASMKMTSRRSRARDLRDEGRRSTTTPGRVATPRRLASP